MKSVSFIPVCVLSLIFIVPSFSWAQSEMFELDNGKAKAQRSFSLQDRTSADVYKEVNRWLVKYYTDPEDNIKARIDSEYLRGVGYHAGFLKNGASSASDLRYTFIMSLKKEVSNSR